MLLQCRLPLNSLRNLPEVSNATTCYTTQLPCSAGFQGQLRHLALSSCLGAWPLGQHASDSRWAPSGHVPACLVPCTTAIAAWRGHFSQLLALAASGPLRSERPPHQLLLTHSFVSRGGTSVALKGRVPAAPKQAQQMPAVTSAACGLQAAERADKQKSAPPPCHRSWPCSRPWPRAFPAQQAARGANQMEMKSRH